MSASSPARPLRDHLGAAVALVLILAMCVTGTPGMDKWGRTAFQDEDARQLVRRRGGALAPVVFVLADLNRTLRLPITEALAPLQRPFRIQQSWHVYGNGPRYVRRLEIWVDGALRYRSRDADHAWIAPVLEHRRVRPIMDTLATKPEATNWAGLGRYVVDRARAEWPEATEVVVLSTLGRFGELQAGPVHGRVATAPDWELVPVGADALPDSQPLLTGARP